MKLFQDPCELRKSLTKAQSPVVVWLRRTLELFTMHVVARTEILKSIKNIKIRNILRAHLNDTDLNIPISQINRIRNLSTPSDGAKVSSFLFGTSGLKKSIYLPNEYSRLFVEHKLNGSNLSKDFPFFYGYLNDYLEEISELLNDISIMNQGILNYDVRSLELVEEFYNKWKLSSFLNTKFCHVLKNSEYDIEFIEKYRHITSLFKVGRRSHQLITFIELSDIYSGSIDDYVHHLTSDLNLSADNFRKNLLYHRLICMPNSPQDAAHFIQRNHATSFVDEVVGLLSLYSIIEIRPVLRSLFDKFIDRGIIDIFEKFQNESTSVLKLIESKISNSDQKFYAYSSAFLEIRTCSMFRSKIDSAILVRLAPKRLGLHFEDNFLTGDYQADRRSLSYTLRDTNIRRMGVDASDDGTLTRTARFLSFLEKYPYDLVFEEDEIRKIFNSTVSLPSLLYAKEITQMYENAENEGKFIVSTLAISLLKQKSRDDDVEFKFARNLENAVINYFKSDLTKFVEWLANRTLNVAKYMVDNLDVHMLEKLYLIMESQEQVNRTRTDVLSKMSDITGDITYFELARRAKVDQKIGKLKQQIDKSRVYVDEISFYRWLNMHILKQISSYIVYTRPNFETIRSNLGDQASDTDIYCALLEDKDFATYDNMIENMLRDAYSAFCLDPHFGIGSYIGRRIRHNTLRANMQSATDNVFRKKGFRPLTNDREFIKRKKIWDQKYGAIIEELRINKIHFRDHAHKDGYFVVNGLEKKDAFVKSVQKIKYYIYMEQSVEICAEEIIELCWKMLEPNLMEFRIYMTNDIKMLVLSYVDEIFIGSSDTETRLRIELKDAISEIINKIASWFRIPESETPSSSVRALAELVHRNCQESYVEFAADLKLGGNCADVIVDPPTVHYLYDCLDIVMENVAEYGRPGHEFRLDFNLDDDQHNSIKRMDVCFVSRLREGRRGDEDYVRLEDQCSTKAELSRAMVREGLSGIQKLRYLISKLDPSASIDTCRKNDELTLKFSLPIGVSKYVKKDPAG